jgi:manganese-transporting P-type ATPase
VNEAAVPLVVRRREKMADTSESSARSVDDLVKQVSLHIPLPTFVHGYFLPFIVLYGAWLYAWIFIYGIDQYLEAGFIVLATIALIQILVSLSCYWSVHVRTFLTCAKEPNPLVAVYAKVVPTPNNGSSKLVKLQKERVSFENGIMI